MWKYIQKTKQQITLSATLFSNDIREEHKAESEEEVLEIKSSAYFVWELE